MSKLKNTLFSLLAIRKLAAPFAVVRQAKVLNSEKNAAGEIIDNNIWSSLVRLKKNEDRKLTTNEISNSQMEEKGDSLFQSAQRQSQEDKLGISYSNSSSSKTNSPQCRSMRNSFRVRRFNEVLFDDDADAVSSVKKYCKSSQNSSVLFSKSTTSSKSQKKTKRIRNQQESLLEYYSRSPDITVKHSATSTKRRLRIEKKKKWIKSLRKIKGRKITKKSVEPFISQRDWRKINGIRLWADKFEKDQYVMENGKFVNKYESKQWKKFVENMKMSVERLQHVTKIHMPLLLPDFIIEMMEGK